MTTKMTTKDNHKDTPKVEKEEKLKAAQVKKSPNHN